MALTKAQCKKSVLTKHNWLSARMQEAAVRNLLIFNLYARLWNGHPECVENCWSEDHNSILVFPRKHFPLSVFYNPHWPDLTPIWELPNVFIIIVLRSAVLGNCGRTIEATHSFLQESWDCIVPLLGVDVLMLSLFEGAGVEPTQSPSTL